VNDAAAERAAIEATLGRPLRIAVVHDWIVTWGGGERALADILRCFPDADLYAAVDFRRADAPADLPAPVATTFVQRLPRARTWYWFYVPLMTLGVEQFDLSGYDLVLSNSHSVAKGVITGPETVHVSYVLSTIRYAWDLQPLYLRAFGYERGLKSALARLAFHYLRIWDTRTAHTADHYLANSTFIATRVRKTYGHDANVVYPPVDTTTFCPDVEGGRDDFYLTASFMNPFKRIGRVVEAFTQMPDRKLVVIGDGPEMPYIRSIATRNIELLGWVPTPVLRDHMRRARAFVFAALEDFGIIMVEAQACGTPVVALGRGGAREIVRDVGDRSDGPPTGVLFPDDDARTIVKAIKRFESEAHRITVDSCRENALRFSAERFRAQFTDEVFAAWRRHGRPA
jgi:glycosyltransferase involved in cell wall biosynthesis